MAITLSDSAAERVRSYLEKRDDSVGLRLGVSETGCSGYAYVIDYADKVLEDDVVFEDKGVTVIVDPRRAEADRRYRGRFPQERSKRDIQLQESQYFRRMRLRRKLQRLK